MLLVQSRWYRLGNNSTSGDHQNCGIVEIGQITEKIPVDMRRLAVAQTPVRNHRLTFVGRTQKEIIIIIIILRQKLKSIKSKM